MITPILEKWLLNGHAKNKIHWVGFGMFAQIQIPTDSYIVIHKVYWNGFLNQKKEDISALSWKEFFSFNEYQLKVQSDKEPPMFYQFRNEVNFQFFGDTALDPIKLLNAPINTAQYDDFILMQPKKQEQIDTFITAYDYLSFTISRNALLPNGGINFAPVNQKANEKPVPFGINGENVLLEVNFVGTNGTVDAINPVGSTLKNTPLQPNNVFNYHQDLDKPALGDNGSFIQNPQSGIRLKHSDYVTNPLFGFEYCIIQKNEAGRLSSL